jgi:hypothetical protein
VQVPVGPALGVRVTKIVVGIITVGPATETIDTLTLVTVTTWQVDEVEKRLEEELEVLLVAFEEDVNAVVEFEGLDDESMVEFAQAVVDRGLGG